VSGRRAVSGAALIVLAVAAAAFPVIFSSPVVTNYAVYALIFVAVVSAWNVFSGFSGYISLGHAVFGAASCSFMPAMKLVSSAGGLAAKRAAKLGLAGPLTALSPAS
jgi:branched-chain amino acid transport system permease protein